MGEKFEKSKSLNQAKERAQQALFDAVAQGVEEIASNETYPPSAQSAQLRNLAYVYRLAAGGAQPGSIEVSK